MTQSTKQPPVSSWHLSDIRELAHLLTQALPAAVQITEAVHQAVCADVAILLEQLGFAVGEPIPSPIEGGDGNREFFVHARRSA